MTIEFRDKNGDYIKQWPNWNGEIPQKGDTVVLHFGDEIPILTELRQQLKKLK